MIIAMNKIKPLLLLFLLTCLASGSYANYSAGLNAFEKKDYKSAFSAWHPLANKGNINAQFNLAWMYEEGKGVVKDYQQAIIWYTKAAQQGDVKSQTNLGVIYANENNTLRDYKLALIWFTKSANKGDASAQNNLAWMYETGKGVDKDNYQAIYWYTKAAQQGNSNAIFKLKQLRNLIDKDNKPVTFSHSGTGFVVSKYGVIATNNHVINGCNKIMIDNLEAELLVGDQEQDLALIKTNELYTHVSQISHKPLKLGEDISVFGFPLSSILSDTSISLTKGSVSGLSGIRNNSNRFRFTAPIQKGNSGGPIINKDGQVIGIVRSMFSGVQNVNFGVKSIRLKELMEKRNLNTNNHIISNENVVDHYSQATKYIECYK